MWRRRAGGALPELWDSIAPTRVRQWPLLADHERDGLQRAATRLLAKRWEAAHGFTIDDAMRISIAANAGLLYAGLDAEPFPNVTAVVIHPSTMRVLGERPGPSPGVVTDAPVHALGHTSSRGPVHLAWDTVERELSTPQVTNVVLHEFAHKMDALDGVMNGTPVLADAAQLGEWVDVCSMELALLRRGESSILRPYAATNPSEFFAVATEAFFQQPVALRAVKPRLYRVFTLFYGLDLAARLAPSSADGVSHTGGLSTLAWMLARPDDAGDGNP